MNDYSTAEEEFRVNKVNELIGQKINPYPSHCQRTYTIQQVIDSFDQLNEQQTKLILVGRLKAIRSHGKATFADLVDGTAKLQVYLKQDNLGEKEYPEEVSYGTYIFTDADFGDCRNILKQEFLKKGK